MASTEQAIQRGSFGPALIGLSILSGLLMVHNWVQDENIANLRRDLRAQQELAKEQFAQTNELNTFRDNQNKLNEDLIRSIEKNAVNILEITGILKNHQALISNRDPRPMFLVGPEPLELNPTVAYPCKPFSYYAQVKSGITQKLWFCNTYGEWNESQR